jgi:hypothetical protein
MSMQSPERPVSLLAAPAERRRGSALELHESRGVRELPR